MRDVKDEATARCTVCCDKQDTGDVSFALEEGATTFTSGREFECCGNVAAMYGTIIDTVRKPKKDKKVKA